jgi:hypothetical protein
MAKKVTLDAMIQRADFAVADENFELELIRDFPLANLAPGSHILRMLRKPDFQRETNQWTPDQLSTFIASFLDNEVIPSLILWKSPTYIFVIDGGHRLSALRAWVEDDYGDGAISYEFYKGEISAEQRAVARRTRALVEKEVGRYTSLAGLVGQPNVGEERSKIRAGRLATRPLNLQWVQGSAETAETSFFKINSQGTPLDDIEELLIRHRRKPTAIAARAVLRAGTGHQYWSGFEEKVRSKIESAAEDLYKLLFQPEAVPPIRTLEVPFGGSVSPVDAHALLIDYLSITGSPSSTPDPLDAQTEDLVGNKVVDILRRAKDVTSRITGNSAGSLGVHPAVYFYNEKGRYNRFLFLGFATVVSAAVKNSNGEFFKRFTEARSGVEKFLIENKNTLGLILQNTNKNQRIVRMQKLFNFLVQYHYLNNGIPSLNAVMEHIQVRGRMLDLGDQAQGASFSDEVKAQVFISESLKSALKCPICSGYMMPTKSVSFDHKRRKREGGMGNSANAQMTHPYCNTGYKS